MLLNALSFVRRERRHTKELLRVTLKPGLRVAVIEPNGADLERHRRSDEERFND